MSSAERIELHRKAQETTILALIIVAAIVCRNYVLATTTLSTDVSNPDERVMQSEVE